MDYQLKTGYGNMDIKAIHTFLSNDSYWARHISLEMVDTALQHSYCAGIFYGDQQVAFARIITDYATFGYLADVYVLPEHRGKGLSNQILRHCLQLEWVLKVRRLMLATADAHDLYKKFGFTALTRPERMMELYHSDIYH